MVQQEPSAGTQAVARTLVTVWVSNGVAQTITLPSVVGSTEDAARAALGVVHVYVTVVHQDVGLAKNDGIVLSMDPVAGSRVKEGTSVTIVVGVYTGATSSPSPGNGNNGNGNGNGNGH